jgi:hypothetical protein
LSTRPSAVAGRSISALGVVELARLFEAGIHRSRTFAAHLRPMLTAMLRHLPYSRHRALRRTLLAAKARPAPAGHAASGAIR